MTADTRSAIAPLPTTSDLESVMLMMHAMKEQLDSMERLFKRRFDEVSMEINATSQLLDMTEEGLSNRFAEILNVLSSISYQGDGHTAANTGVELEAVIADTEEAANKILDAADRISNRIESQDLDDNPEAHRAFLLETKEDVQAILMACTFQDITGQRIRKTLERLQTVESRITSTLDKLGIEVKPDPMAGGIRDSVENHAASQDDIDALFK